MTAASRLELEYHYRKIFDRLERLSWHDNGGYFKARCPAHDDRVPSLALRLCQTGKLIVKCHTGCSFEKIVAALSLEARDFFPPQLEVQGKKMKIVKEYDYRHENGNLAYQTVRFDPKDFRQRQPAKETGKWLWNLQNVRLVPYRLPELLAAAPERTVFLCEGERDADRLTRLGLVATTNVCGAGKWRADYGRYFYLRRVVVFPDNDAVGHKHAEQVVQHLSPIVSSIKLVLLPGLEEKQDISDWLDKFPVNTTVKQHLERLAVHVKAAPELAVKSTTLPGLDKMLSELRAEKPCQTVEQGLFMLRRAYMKAEQAAFERIEGRGDNLLSSLEYCGLTGLWLAENLRPVLSNGQQK